MYTRSRSVRLTDKSGRIGLLMLAVTLLLPVGPAIAGIGPYGGAIYSIAVDPKHPSTLYAAGGSLFKSTDGGQNWAVCRHGLERQVVNMVIVDPSDPAVLFAGTSTRGLYRSTDRGEQWTP